MDKRLIIGLGVLAAVLGVFFWRKSGSSKDAQPEGQDAASAAAQYYDTPPNLGVQTGVSDVVSNQNGNITVSSRQTMPLPYNT
jgi:hypothetical protein